jgi:hypothetical protein
MQNEMNIDTLPTAIAYESKTADIRKRSASVQSNHSAEVFAVESDLDEEILLGDLEVSDSPVILLRKKLGSSNI